MDSCLNAMDSCQHEPTVIFRRTKTSSPAVRRLHQFLCRYLKRWRKGRPFSPAEGDMNHAVYPVGCPTEIRNEGPCSISAKQGINRITPEMCKLTEDSKMAVEAIKLLDEAINFHQINCIVKAREKLHIFLRLMKHSKCMFPSKYGWEVVDRGKNIFLDESVSCSVKHGIILLDASNAGAQFHAALFNILGAFALETSEFQIAHEAYSLLIDIHGRSDATSRLRDLGAAYNNRGCISLAMGDFSQAEDDFANALTHLKWKRRKQYDSSLHSLIIAVDSNSSRLDLMSRNFVRSLKKQEKLVEVCKEKQIELPVETIFVVMHNQAVLHTTLGNFSIAEKELRWMIEYCKTLRRDDWDFLLNFVALHLYEVLLTRGKPEEAELVLPSETLTATSVYDLIPPFEGLHFNLKIEALEKLVDVFVKSGKIKWAYDLLESGLKCIEDVYGPEHFNVALLLYKQASILKLMGDATGSMEKFEGSEGILREIFTERHPLLMKCYMSLGEVAFDLGHTNNSNIYFQRAVEHVENIFKISYPTQLSVRYTEITTASKCSSCEIVSGNQTKDPQEQKTEGLVAEYGFALAVLSSHISVQRAPRKPTTEGEQALKKKNMNLDFTESSLISQKCARDLLQSGQVLLRQGMTTEAVSFFQLASKYCQAQEVAQNISDLQLVRLYTVFSQSKLNVQNEMEINDVLKRTLEEVTLDSGINGAGEKNSEHTGLLASDCDLSLKLVLILFILLSMQLEMYDITFAAYDRYASLFSKDAKLVLSLNHGLQFYASRISITCNGKTAVQDFLLCSATGLFKDDSESHGRPLFKSLAVRKNAPTNRILVTCRTTSFLDIDDLTRLEEKVLCSFQELFQNNFLDREESATQVFVDLTPTVSFAGKSQLTNSAIELLPICLMNDETEGENDEMHTISEKPPSVCEKITHVTFPDEPTSCLMFSRIGINLLQQCHTGRISTLRVQNQCLSLTITQPFKARITLCREGRSVKQSLEVLSAAEANHLSDEIAPQQSRAEYVDRSLCSRAFERFSAAPILHWAKARQIPFETTVVLHRCSHSFGPPIISSVVSEANELHGLQTEPFFIQETEKCRDLRKRIELNTLECLTAISEISQQLSTEEDSENACEEEQSRTQTDHFREPRDQHITSGSSYRDTPLSQNEELTTSSTFQPAACDSSASGERQTVLLSRCLASVRSDTNHLSHDDSAVTLEPTGDEAALGRRLFEQARKSRISFVAKIQEDLSRKETPRQVESLQCWRSSSNETPDDNIGTDQGHPLYEGHVGGSGRNSSSPEEVLQTFNGSLPRKQQQPSGACDENEAKDFLLTNEEVQIDDSTFSGGGRGGAEQISESPEIAKKTLNDVMGTVNQNVTPKDGPDVALMNKGTEAPKGRSEITCSDQYQTNSHGQRDLQNVLMASEESEDLREVKRNIFEGEAEKDFILMEQSEKHDRRKSATSEKEVFSQIESGVAGVNSLTKTLTLVSQGEDEEEPSLEGGLDKYLDTVWGYDSDRRLWSCESGMEERKCKRSQDNVKQEDQQSQMIYEEKSHKSDRQKANIPYSSLDSDVVPDGDVTYGFSKEVVPATQTTPNSVLKGYRDSKGDFKTSSDGSPRLIDAGDVIDGTGSSCKVDILTDFGGARPKTNRAFRNGTKLMHTVLADQSQKKPVGLDPDFVARHAFINDSFHSSTDYLNCNGARWNGPTLQTSEDHHFSATIFSGTYSSKVHNVFGESSLQAYHKPKRINLRSPADKDFPGESEDESWQFPPPTTAAEKYFPPSYSQVNHTCDNHESVTQRKFSCDPCPDCPDSRVDLDEMLSMMKEFKSKSIEYGNGAVRSRTNSPPSSLESYEDHTCDNHESVTQIKFSCDPCPDCPDSRVDRDEILSMMNELKSKSIEYGNGAVRSTTNSPPSSLESYEDPGNSYEDQTMSLLEQLKGAMARTVRIVKNFTSSGDVERQFDPAQNPDKIGIQEQSQGDGENQHSETERDTNASEGEAHRQQTEQTEDTVTEVPRAPIQETPRAVCKHYQRRCLVKFPCCGNFYPCHRCHNESQECSEDQARAISATHIRCTICYHEQVIDEASQTCQGCNSKMSAFFCPICKHFTSVEKNPFHCEKCGICRIHKDKSFHCDVCNVCLDKRLQGKHKCRPDSGHDECCICLEDAFSGCQILPCSHKVHKDCAIAMIQNGVRRCPICRHPLFQQRNNTNQ